MLTVERVTAALEAVRVRLPTDLGALARARRSDVVRWVRMPHGTLAYRPEPWASEREGQDGVPEEVAEAATPARLVGYDQDDRVTLVVDKWDESESPYVHEVWFHGDGWSDRVDEDEVVRALLDATGRVVAMVGVSGGRPFVKRWTWHDGVARRAVETTRFEETMLVEALVAELDDDGRLALLRRGVRRVECEDANEAAALLAALAHAGDVVTDAIEFDARLHRREPRLRDTDALVALLAPAVERAVVEAVARCDVLQPFAVELHRGREHVAPFVRIGSAAFRDRVRTTLPARHAALKLLADARPPDGQTISLVDMLDAEALRACRELDWALDPAALLWHLEGDGRNDARYRADDALDALGDELARRLNQRAWPGSADPFLVLVHLGAPRRPVRPFVRAAQAVGKRRVQAFRRSIATEPRAPVAVPAEALHDRDALHRFLAASGLTADAARLAHEVARIGLRLDATDATQARSRLGGPGLLPPGAEWPHADGQRPHTFLAGIDLAELPATDELPAAGWLLFFADIDHGGQALGLIDVSDNSPGAQIHVTFLEPGVAPAAAAPPANLSVVLRERRVRGVAQLTLPTSWAAGSRLGLGPIEQALYDAAIERSVAPPYGCHWILGWESGVQGSLPEDDSALLLHLADDSALDFNYMDAGAIQFRIARAPLEAGDWSAVIAYADSC